jgi:hypothetical protein
MVFMTGQELPVSLARKNSKVQVVSAKDHVAVKDCLYKLDAPATC